MKDLKFQTAEQTMKHSNVKGGGDSDFYTNHNKGFAMAINGFRISVQWGPGNYVDREVRYDDHDAPMQHNIWGCDTAEVLIWGRNDEPLFNLVPFDFDTEEYDKEMFDAQGGHIDQVFGHCSSDCVAKMIGCLASCGDNDPRRAIAQIYNANC